MALFGNKKQKTNESSRVLTKDYMRVLKSIKRMRIDQTSHSNSSLNEIGKDLAYIDRKAREYYNFTAKYVKDGHTQDEAYLELLTNHVATDVDKQIIEQLFVLKK